MEYDRYLPILQAAAKDDIDGAVNEVQRIIQEFQATRPFIDPEEPQSEPGEVLAFIEGMRAISTAVRPENDRGQLHVWMGIETYTFELPEVKAWIDAPTLGQRIAEEKRRNEADRQRGRKRVKPRREDPRLIARIGKRDRA